MRAAKAILVYAAAVVVVGALLAPWLFRLVHPYLTDVPFRRVFNRVMLGVAVVGLWPFLRALGIRSWREVGYLHTSAWWRHVLLGLLIGIVSLSVAGALLVVMGSRSIVVPASGVGHWLGFLAAGIAVAVIEETFFRGGLQGALQRSLSVPVAIFVTSAVYSAVHFLKPKGAGVAADTVNWLSGFVYLGKVLTLSWRAPGVAVGFVTLLLAGGILGAAFARTRGLYVSMGIHAGWVFTLKAYARLTNGASLVDNVLVWPVLAFVLWVCWRKLKPLQP